MRNYSVFGYDFATGPMKFFKMVDTTVPERYLTVG
jgi:hypothetical protein